MPSHRFPLQSRDITFSLGFLDLSVSTGYYCLVFGLWETCFTVNLCSWVLSCDGQGSSACRKKRVLQLKLPLKSFQIASTWKILLFWSWSTLLQWIALEYMSTCVLICWNKWRSKKIQTKLWEWFQFLFFSAVTFIVISHSLCFPWQYATPAPLSFPMRLHSKSLAHSMK